MTAERPACDCHGAPMTLKGDGFTCSVRNAEATARHRKRDPNGAVMNYEQGFGRMIARARYDLGVALARRETLREEAAQ